MLVGAAVAVALGLGSLGAIGLAADAGELRDALIAADSRWLLVAVGAVIAGYAGYVAAFRAVVRARGGPVLPYGVAAQVVAVGIGANVLASTPGGLAVDMWALQRAGLSLHATARRAVAFKTLEWTVLGVLVGGAAIAVLAGADAGVPAALAIGWTAVVATCLLGAALVASGSRAERWGHVRPGRRLRGLRGVSPRRPGTWWPWAADKLRVGRADVIGGLRLMGEIVSRPRRHRWAGPGAAVYWLGHLVALDAATRAVGSPLGPAGLILAFATGYAATVLPLPAGGAGGVDATMVVGLTAVGVGLPPAVLAVLVYRGATFWLPIAPALPVVATIPRLHEEVLPACAPARRAPEG